MIRVRYIGLNAGNVLDFEDKDLDNALRTANQYIAFPDGRDHVVDSLETYGRYSVNSTQGWVEVFKPMKG